LAQVVLSLREQRLATPIDILSVPADVSWQNNAGIGHSFVVLASISCPREVEQEVGYFHSISIRILIH